VSATPDGWNEATLASACRVVSGATPKTGVAENWGDDVAWLTPADMSRDRSQVLRGGARGLSLRGYESCSAQIVPAGSVVVSSRAPVGYVAIAGAPLATSQGCKTAVLPDHLDSRYVYWFMVHARPDLEKRASGTTFKEISAKEFGRTVLVYPPLDEQRRIVDILEDHLSHLDAADLAIQQSLARLDGLDEQIVLRSLLPFEHGYSPDNVDAVAAGALVPLRAGWRWSSLSDVASVVGGVAKDAKRQDDPSFVEVPYLRVANVQRTHLVLESVTTIRTSAKKAAELRLLPGDVLMNEGGDRDKLARGWVWSGEIQDCIHQNHVFRARPERRVVHPEWLAWSANTVGSRWAARHGKQSVNLASISLSTIRRMPVPLAPLEEQALRLQQITESLDGTSALRQSLRLASDHSASLRRSLLAAAFSGQLTGRSSDLERVEELVS